MSEVPLTKEQREFAAKWHNLIYVFLREKGLPRDEYYDIVVFGYLRAVKRYFTELALQNYSFSTIAWQAMQQSLSADRRAQNSQKRHACVISLHSAIYDDGQFALEDVLSTQDSVMEQLETELLLHDLAAMASRQQMAVVRMKSAGYNMRDIAKNQRIPMKRVRELLEEIRLLLEVVCYG